MALFTDGLISALEDLTAQDASIFDIASSEGIDLTRKLELAQEEVGIELAAVLMRIDGGGSWVPANVVLSPALKLWHTFRTLELAYRDAYHNQLNDRYRGRRDEYRDLARWAAEKLLQTGIGLTEDPVPRAGIPGLRTVAGTMLAGTYFVTMCWVGRSGAEGANSPVQPFDLVLPGGIGVRPGEAPANAAGWNVYVGLTEDTVRLQNTSVLAATEDWLQTMEPSNNGRGPSSGPEATSFRQAPRVIQRG